MSKSRDAEKIRSGFRSGSKDDSRHSKSSNEIKLALALLEWATGEMGYGAGEEGLPSREEMRLLVRGDFAEFWKYVVGHIKSPRHSQGGDGGLLKTGLQAERAVVEEQRSHLTRELASLRLAVEQMEKDILQTRESISQLEVSNSMVRGETSQLARGRALLSAHSVACQEMINMLQEFARRISGRVDIFRPSVREAAYFSRQDGGGEGSQSAGLESACTREVRIICLHLEQVLSCKEDGGQRSAARERAREQSWNKIEALLGQYRPAEILSSLVDITQHAAKLLHSDTDSVDLKRDAQQLKYSYDLSGVKDVSKEPSLLGAVEEQLLEAQLSHIQRSVESERAQQVAREAQQKTLALQSQVNQLLMERYRDNTEGLQLAKLNLQLELECAGSGASLGRLTALCSSLGSARDQRQGALEQLHAKHKRILEFTQVADSKQRKIQTLVAHNSAAKDGLLRQAVELQLYIQQNVVSHRTPLHCKAGLLRDGAAHEVHLFRNLSLERLHKPPSLDVPICDLSINRLRTVQPSGHPSWDTILRSLAISSYSSPETVLSKLLETKEKVWVLRLVSGTADKATLPALVDTLDKNVAEMKHVVEEMKATAVDKCGSQSVLSACQDYDQDLVKTSVPALQHCLSLASHGLATCERTEETLEHWWAQPGQYLAPWATHDGMSVAKWIEQWRTLATKFTSLLEQ